MSDTELQKMVDDLVEDTYSDAKLLSECPRDAYCSTASQESMNAAMLLTQYLWDNQKISYKFDNIIDVELLAYVIENRKMP